jgi:hypothetical protein
MKSICPISMQQLTIAHSWHKIIYDYLHVAYILGEIYRVIKRILADMSLINALHTYKIDL